MEEQAHHLELSRREKGSVTGVLEVIAFDEHEILLKTSQGMLTIKGNDLHVSRLDLDSGETELEGKVDALLYSGKEPKKKKGSALARLFG